jgi:tetratricopeptide (TPR) repeat protein
LIALAPARPLSAPQECAVLRAAAARAPLSPARRHRLAALLHQLDAFDEAIALLAEAPDLGHRERLLLADALFARGDTDRALAVSREAEAAAATAPERAAALAEQGKAHLRLGASAAARGALRKALALDPTHRQALKRLAVDLLSQGEAAELLALADALAAQGVGHARLLSVRALALAQLGRPAAADVLRLEAFLHREQVALPAGLAAELLSHPALRYERHGTASVDSWRIDSLTAGGGAQAAAALRLILAAVTRRRNALAGTDHPWVAAMPARATLRSWCVITEGAGHEAWHMHPHGWMSGVCYVAVPDAVAAGEGPAGCLTLGLADGLIDPAAAAAAGRAWVRPRAGLLATFPSHAHHRTFPHRAAGQRICIAFDVEPA